jgi:ADP-heptose:LPS heptosyltransferase
VDRSLHNKLRPTDLHVLITRGGIGDSVARMPAVRYILDTYEHVKTVRLFCQDNFVEFAQHLFKPYGARIEIYGYSEMEEIFDKYPNTPGVKTDHEHHTTLRTHLTDHAFATLADTQTWDEEVKAYVRVRPEEIVYETPEGPYVVLCTGFTAPVREWLPGYVNEVAAYLKSKGITPVLLGSKKSEFWKDRAATSTTFRDDEINTEGCIDLRDETTLLQAAKVIARAEAICGVDNGLIHIAGCTDTPIVAGYTSVSSDHRAPFRTTSSTGIIEPEVACAGCQTKMGFVYNFDFRSCYFGDYKCTIEMRASKFIDALEMVLP